MYFNIIGVDIFVITVYIHCGDYEYIQGLNKLKEWDGRERYCAVQYKKGTSHHYSCIFRNAASEIRATIYYSCPIQVRDRGLFYRSVTLFTNS